MRILNASFSKDKITHIYFRLSYPDHGVSVVLLPDEKEGSGLDPGLRRELQRRLHVLQGRAQLSEFERGGLNVLTCSAAQFGKRLRAENRTIKRRLGP